LVRVHAAPPNVPVYAKLESFNPGASVKDRIGRYTFERMSERGDLSEGGTVVEPTAGNTGIGFAVAAKQLGVNAVFVERQTTMRALGAEVINTPTEAGMGGAIDRAYRLTEELDDAVVAGCGTAGTLMGMARYFRKQNPETHVVAVEPEGVRRAPVGSLRKCKEKAPPFRAGMNPTMHYTTTVHTLGRIFNA
jgi:cysteine synthase A